MALSGRWSGYREARGWGRRPLRLTLRLGDGLIEGEGDDCIGAFTFRGSYDESGQVSMVKSYVGQHQVRYDGAYDGEGTTFGAWSIAPDWTGPFALTLERADQATQEAVMILPATRSPDR